MAADDPLLFDFDREVEPLLEVLVARAINHANLEIREEEYQAKLQRRLRQMESLQRARRLAKDKCVYRSNRYQTEIAKRRHEKALFVNEAGQVHRKLYCREYVKSFKGRPMLEGFIHRLAAKHLLRQSLTGRLKAQFTEKLHRSMSRCLHESGANLTMVRHMVSKASSLLAQKHQGTVDWQRQAVQERMDRARRKKQEQQKRERERLVHQKFLEKRARKLAVFEEMKPIIEARQSANQKQLSTAMMQGYWELIKLVENGHNPPRRKSRLMHSDLFGMGLNLLVIITVLFFRELERNEHMSKPPKKSLLGQNKSDKIVFKSASKQTEQTELSTFNSVQGVRLKKRGKAGQSGKGMFDGIHLRELEQPLFAAKINAVVKLQKPVRRRKLSNSKNSFGQRGSGKKSTQEDKDRRLFLNALKGKNKKLSLEQKGFKKEKRAPRKRSNYSKQASKKPSLESKRSSIPGKLRRGQILESRLNKMAPEFLEKMLSEWSRCHPGLRFQLPVSKELYDTLQIYEMVVWHRLIADEFQLPESEKSQDAEPGNQAHYFSAELSDDMVRKVLPKNSDARTEALFRSNKLLFLLHAYRHMNMTPTHYLLKKHETKEDPAEESEVVTLRPWIKTASFVGSAELEEIIRFFENIDFGDDESSLQSIEFEQTNAHYRNEMIWFLIREKIMTRDLYVNFLKAMIKVRMGLLVTGFKYQVTKHTMLYENEETKVITEKLTTMDKGRLTRPQELRGPQRQVRAQVLHQDSRVLQLQQALPHPLPGLSRQRLARAPLVPGHFASQSRSHGPQKKVPAAGLGPRGQ